MPGLKTESFGTGDMSALDSAHGIHNCRTDLLDISAFTAGTHYPNGHIVPMTPVAKVGGVLVPYTSAEATTTGAGVLWGHIFGAQPVRGTEDFAVPVLQHARVKAAKVPAGSDAFTAPVAAAKRAATTINYV